MRALIAGGRLRRVTWTYHATADVLTVTWPCGCGVTASDFIAAASEYLGSLAR